MRNLQFLPLTLEHCPAVTELYIKTYAADPWFETHDAALIMAFIKTHLNNNFFLGQVALLDGKPVAAALAFKKPWHQGIELYVDEFFVDSDLQGQGIGRALMQHLEACCQEQGMNALILNTWQGYPAQQFYQQMGFTEHPELVVLTKMVS